MGLIVFTPIDEVAVTTDVDQDIWIIGGATGAKLTVHEWQVTSEATTADMVRLRLLRRSTLGSGGAPATEVKRDIDDGTIVGSMTTLQTTTGTIGDILEGHKWEQLGPLGHLYTPETRPIIDDSVTAFLALNLFSAVAAETDWSGFVIWEVD